MGWRRVVAAGGGVAVLGSFSIFYLVKWIKVSVLKNKSSYSHVHILKIDDYVRTSHKILESTQQFEPTSQMSQTYLSMAEMAQ